jgi:hypothetical protein
MSNNHNYPGCDHLVRVLMEIRANRVTPTEGEMVIFREIAIRTYTGVRENGRYTTEESIRRFEAFRDEIFEVLDTTDFEDDDYYDQDRPELDYVFWPREC